jgi:tight adherence protein C
VNGVVVGAWLAVAACAAGARYALWRVLRERRLRRMGWSPPSRERRVPWAGLAERLGRHLLTPRGRFRWETRLMLAGRREAAHVFVGRMALLGIATFLASLGLFSLLHAAAALTLAGAALVGGLAGLLPGSHLRTVADRRRLRLLGQLPEVLDFLGVSLSAGLAFESALQHIVPQLDDPVAGELRRVVEDLRLGTTRRDALTGLARRTGLVELDRLAGLVAQADALGRGIAESLHAEALRLRDARLMEARMRAARIPVRLSLPLVAFLFPALYVVLLGPAAMDILRVLGGRP